MSKLKKRQPLRLRNHRTGEVFLLIGEQEGTCQAELVFECVTTQFHERKETRKFLYDRFEVLD
jgi:hypothetical protein